MHLPIFQAMRRWTLTMNQWCWLKNAHFVLVGGRYFTGIGAAV